jgi:hypothetical protein
MIIAHVINGKKRLVINKKHVTFVQFYGIYDYIRMEE